MKGRLLVDKESEEAYKKLILEMGLVELICSGPFKAAPLRMETAEIIRL